MRREMGVNNISHYNYSHTATPMHHQLPPTPHFTLFLPQFSICLNSYFFSLPLPFDLITPVFFLLPVTHSFIF